MQNPFPLRYGTLDENSIKWEFYGGKYGKATEENRGEQKKRIIEDQKTIHLNQTG